MALYKNPDFCRLPSGLMSIFDRDNRQSFFALPHWYGLLARFGVQDGTEIRVYTDERPGSSVALLLQTGRDRGSLSLSSLAGFYSVEHGPVSAPDADQHRALGAIVAEIVADRPRWDCIRFAELNPRETSYRAL